MSGPATWLDDAVARRLQAALDRSVPATPAAVRALAATLDTQADRVVPLRSWMDAARTAHAELAASRDDPSAADGPMLRRYALRARDEALEAGLRGLRDRIRAVADALDGADRRTRDAATIAEEAWTLVSRATALLRPPPPEPVVAEAPSPSSDPDPVDADPDLCRVEGCGSPVKARGFCSRHYGQWYRGRLTGWVLADGLVRFDDGTRWRVDVAHAGEPATPTAEGVAVMGSPVEARAVR